MSGCGWKEGYVGIAKIPAELSSQAGYTLIANEPVTVENWLSERRFQSPDILKEHQVKSGISTIIYKKNAKPYGVLGVHTKNQRSFTSDDVNFVQSVANILAVSIERKEAEEQIWKFTEELEQRVLERTEQLTETNVMLSHEIAEHQQTEKALRESETRFKAIFNQTFEFIGLLKLDGTVIKANETALRFINAKPSEIEGAFLWDTPWFNHSAELRNQIMEAVENAAQGQFVRFEAKHYGVNQEEITVDFSLKPVIDEAGQVYLLIPEGRDITERKKMEIELVNAKKHADYANEQKSKILAFVSHDLKNPLNCIIGFSEMMGSGMIGELTEKQQQYARNITVSSRHMLDLVMDVLDKARFESGQLRLTPEWIDLRPFASEIQTLLQHQADEHQVSLHTRVAKEVSGLEADGAQLKQVFLNLVGNAIKYNNPHGKVILSFALSKDKQHVVCKVIDTGLGVSQADLPHLFEEFYRVKSTETKKIEGTGLGLPFVKRIVELHGGNISVTSELNVGSMFTVILPVCSAVPHNVENTMISTEY